MRGLQNGAGGFILLLVGIGIVILIVLGLSSCQSPEAQRLNAQANLDYAQAERARAHGEAEAARIRAEAEADAEREEAQVEAAERMAATRQMERDAAHQRALDLLPYVVAIGGGLMLAGLAGFLWWDLRSAQRGQAGMLVYLERLRLDQMERDRQMWQAIGRLTRQGLPPGDDGQGVIVYKDELRQ